MVKTYEALRTPDGDVMAFVNGEPLYHVVAHTPDGFAFGRGPGADDLALSILADFFGERPTLEDLYQGECLCLYYHHDFKWAVVAPASARGAFKVTTHDIERWLDYQ